MQKDKFLPGTRFTGHKNFRTIREMRVVKHREIASYICPPLGLIVHITINKNHNLEIRSSFC